MKIELIKWEENHCNDFYKASTFQELYNNMSDTFPKTQDECQNIVTVFANSNDTTEFARAICVEGAVVGCIAAFFDKDLYCKNAEIAYWICKDFWGKGIMNEVIKIYTEGLFSSYDIQRIYARPFERNKASQKVLEKAGYICEGTLRKSVYKDGKVLNAMLYSIVH